MSLQSAVAVKMLRLAVMFTAFYLGLATPVEHIDYQKVFEEIDPDLILDNERLLRAYLKCFFDEGPCNVHQQAVKDHIPTVLSTVCGECSQKQKGIFKHSLNKFIPAHGDDWAHMLRIYDPDGAYWPNIKAFIES